MAKLTELFESTWMGKEIPIYFLTFDAYEAYGAGLIEVYGIFLEKHKAEKARRFLIKEQIEGMEDEDAGEQLNLYKYWNEMYQVHEVTTGLLNYGTKGYVTDIIDNLTNSKKRHQ